MCTCEGEKIPVVWTHLAKGRNKEKVGITIEWQSDLEKIKVTAEWKKNRVYWKIMRWRPKFLQRQCEDARYFYYTYLNNCYKNI